MRLLVRLCDELSEDERASMGCAESVEATAEATVHCLCRAGTAVSSMFAHSVSDLTRGDVQGCSPDAEESLRCKDRGSGLFKKGKLQDAAQEWSMALRLNDEQGQAGSRMAAILYSNRLASWSRISLLKPPPIHCSPLPFSLTDSLAPEQLGIVVSHLSFSPQPPLNACSSFGLRLEA